MIGRECEREREGVGERVGRVRGSGRESGESERGE